MQIHAATRLLAETFRDYVRRLAKLGIRKIKSGGSAHVFQHPTMPDVVVKLLHGRDPAYQRYAKFCKAHAANPYCPVIHQIVSADQAFDGPKWKQSQLYLVFMEKLRPCTESDYREFADYCFDLVDIQAVRYDPEFVFSKIATWEKLAAQTEDTNLAQLAGFVVKTYKANRFAFDFHQGNIMKRGSQMVIVDPFIS